MSAEHKDESPRLDPVWERSQIVQDIEATFNKYVDQTAIAVASDFTILRVLQGNVATFDNGEGEFYKGMAMGLVHLTCADNTEYTQLRTRGYATGFFEYDLQPSRDTLSQLTNENANRDSIFRHMLGRTVFTRAKSERSLERFIKLPILLGETIVSRLSDIA